MIRKAQSARRAGPRLIRLAGTPGARTVPQDPCVGFLVSGRPGRPRTRRCVEACRLAPRCRNNAYKFRALPHLAKQSRDNAHSSWTAGVRLFLSNVSLPGGLAGWSLAAVHGPSRRVGLVNCLLGFDGLVEARRASLARVPIGLCPGRHPSERTHWECHGSRWR